MYNVALIGMGNIGFTFDKDPNTKTAFSHAKGIYLHKEFNLKYIADPSDTNLNDLKKLFPKVIYSHDYTTLLNISDIDILVIATPTHLHKSILIDFQVNLHIKTFFIEKPLFSIDEDHTGISENIKKKIIINYPRRFDPNIQEVRKQLLFQPYGSLKKAIIKYSKGFSNNGSHAIDLLHCFLENFSLENPKILQRLPGFDNQDLTLDIYGQLLMKNTVSQLYFMGFDHNHLTTFSLELYFKKAIVKYDDTELTISISEIKADKQYPAYLTEAEPMFLKDLNMDKIMLLAYEDLYKKLTDEISHASTFYDEIKNLKFKNKILKEDKCQS